jgi:hypothetical protein
MNLPSMVQPLLQVPNNFNFRSPATISGHGVAALNETSLPGKEKSRSLCLGVIRAVIGRTQQLKISYI